MDERQKISLESAHYAEDVTRKAFEKIGLTELRLAKEIKPLALSDMGDYLTKEGEALIDPAKLRKHSKAIKRLKQITKTFPDGSKETRIEFELYPKDAVINSVAGMLGMVVEKHEHTGKGGGPIETTFTNFPPQPKTIAEWEEQVKAAKEAKQ